MQRRSPFIMNKVLILVIDGCAPEYITPEFAPNIHRLAKPHPTVPCTNRKCRCWPSIRLRLRRFISTARTLRRCCLSRYESLFPAVFPTGSGSIGKVTRQWFGIVEMK